MPDTFIKIASVTVGSGGAASMSFSSIPSTYTDLCVKISGRSSRTGVGYDDLNFSLNGSTSSFSTRSIQGSGSSVSSFNSTNFLGQLDTAANTSSTFTSVDFYIPNYAGSTNKSFTSDSVQEDNATTAYSNLVAGLWSNTAAITSITLNPGVGSFVQYSTATLYGIKNS